MIDVSMRQSPRQTSSIQKARSPHLLCQNMRLGDETRDTPFDGHFAELLSALLPKANIGTQSLFVTRRLNMAISLSATDCSDTLGYCRSACGIQQLFKRIRVSLMLAKKSTRHLAS